MSTVLTSKTWWEAALVRAVKTAAQSMVATGLTSMTSVLDTDIVGVITVGAGGFVFSLLTSLAGLPEVDETPRGKHNA
jgi:hypothetical protein